jgi:hypothetical protein
MLVLGATTTKEARKLIRTEAVDALVIELSFLKRSDLAPLREFERFGSLPLVLYGELTSGFFQAALDIASWINPKIFLKGIEDSIQRVQEFAWSLPPARVRRLLNDELHRRYFGKLTPRSQIALAVTWAARPKHQGLARLATNAGYTSEWMRRLLAAVGMSQPHLVWDAIAVIDSWWYARDLGFADTDIAVKCACGNRKRLKELWARFLPRCASQAVAAMVEDEVVRCVLNRLGAVDRVRGRAR